MPVTVGDLCAPGPDEPTTPTSTTGDLPASPMTEQFEVFYQREFGKVVKVVWGRTGSLAAEDIAQDAFLEALKNWDSGDCISKYEKPDAWVCKVAMRLAGRWRHRQLVGMKKVAAAAFHSSSVVGFTDLPPTSVDFWRQVRSLPSREADVLVLHYVGGYKVAEIAGMFDIKEGTVKRYLHDGRDRLASLLEPQVEHGDEHER